MSNAPLKIAVVGVGAFGELHARTLARLSETTLVALVDHNLPRAQNLAAELNIPRAMASVGELIEAQVADAVVIATRTDTHISYAQEAMAAGLHVLIEKPVGQSAATIAAFEKFCREASPVAMAGHICLFHSLTTPLIRKVRENGFRSLHFVRHRPRELALLFAEEHPFNMTMVHDLYILSQMVDNEEPVRIAGLERHNDKGTTDLSWATLCWTDGRVATLHSNWTLPAGAPGDGWDAIDVFGVDYHARIATNPQNMQWTQENATWPLNHEISEVGGRPTGMLAEELRSFVAACHSSQVPPGCRMCDAVQVQRWVEALRDSASKQQ